MKRNIVFIGSMGSGKSHIGRNLAEAMNWQFVDTDRYLEQKYKAPIATVYERLGEKAFKQAEKSLLKQVSKYHEAVISFGGNFPMDIRTIKMLKKESFVIVLQADKHRIVNRIKRRIGKRPTMNYDDIAGFVKAMMDDWIPAYKYSHIVLDTTFGNSEALVETVLQAIKKNNIVFKKRRGEGREYYEEHRRIN